VVVGFVVGVSLLLLLVMFRAPVVALKAAVMNLLSIAAAYGVIIAVFQWGWGVRALGLPHAVPMSSWLPLLMFVVLFGLSMDYEVFLVARVREARVAGLGEREAIASGLVHTGKLITSAAAIMLVVFGAFMLGDFLLMKMLGFALSVAVLLDATVMRLAVSPALLVLAGRWNWWPGEKTGAEVMRSRACDTTPSRTSRLRS